MTQIPTPLPGTSDVARVGGLPAMSIEDFKAALAAKYAGVTDRQLLELIAHNGEATRAEAASITRLVKPAMDSIASGGIMGLLGGLKKAR